MWDAAEFARWWRQAEQTLHAAQHDAAGGFWNWACFKAEQAAQLAVKGLLRALGVPAFGHSLMRLLDDLERIGIAVPESVRKAGRELEREYIPTRYPDTYPSGSPYEFYDADRARALLDACQHVLRFVRKSQGVHAAMRCRKQEQSERVAAAQRFVQRLRAEARLGALTAWVYGSVARGTFKAWSDTDVFVVAERLPDHPLQRWDLLYRYAADGVEPKAWTREEFLARLEKNDAQLLAMLRDRIVLVDDLHLEERLRTHLDACAHQSERG